MGYTTVVVAVFVIWLGSYTIHFTIIQSPCLQNDSNHCQLLCKHFSQLMKLLLKHNNHSEKGQYDFFVYYYWKVIYRYTLK